MTINPYREYHYNGCCHQYAEFWYYNNATNAWENQGSNTASFPFISGFTWNYVTGNTAGTMSFYTTDAGVAAWKPSATFKFLIKVWNAHATSTSYQWEFDVTYVDECVNNVLYFNTGSSWSENNEYIILASGTNTLI